MIRYCDFLNGNDGTGDGSIGNPYKNLQAAWNVGARGDRFRIADSAMQQPAAPIDSSLGFNNTGTLVTTIEPYSVSGAVTIQRPDETTPRIAAGFDGLSAVNSWFLLTNMPPLFVARDIILCNFLQWAIDAYATDDVLLDGCEVYNCGAQFGAPIGLRSVGIMENCYVHDCIVGSNTVGLDPSNDQVNNCFFENNTPTVGIISADNAMECARNIFKLSGNNAVAIAGVNRITNINNNTFVSDGSDGQVGVTTGVSSAIQQFVDNVFKGFTGVGSRPYNITVGSDIKRFGNNLIADSNAAVNLASVGATYPEVTGTLPIFVDEVNDDYTLVAAYRGTGLSSPNSFADVGAIQSKSEVIIPSTDQNQYRANRSCE